MVPASRVCGWVSVCVCVSVCKAGPSFPVSLEVVVEKFTVCIWGPTETPEVGEGEKKSQKSMTVLVFLIPVGEGKA